MEYLQKALNKCLRTQIKETKIECGNFLVDVEIEDGMVFMKLHRRIIDVSFYSLYGWIPQYRLKIHPSNLDSCVNYLENSLRREDWASVEFALLKLLREDKLTILV